MNLPPFDYATPASVEDAIALLVKHGSDARILAGGQSLLVLLKQRAIAPKLLVNLSRIDTLRGIEQREGEVRIGAMATQAELLESGALMRWFGPSGLDASGLGDPMVRNRGTLGGALAFGDPAGDWAPIMLALGATFTAQGPTGTRSIPTGAFFSDSFTTALQTEELLTHITIPLPADGARAVYRKYPQPASQAALVGVAAVLECDEHGRCRDCRVAITGAGRFPARAGAVEMALRDARVSEEVIARAAGQAADELELRDGLFAGPEYRALLARTYVKRALLDAFRTAGQAVAHAA